MHIHSFQEFINSFYLWRDALIVAAATGGICGFLGVYVILRRIVFVSIALTQVSSFGVVLGFYVKTLVVSSFFLVSDPFIFSVTITLIAALFFALKKNYFPLKQEDIIAFGFIIASSLLLIMSGLIVEELHEVNNILFGNAVVVEPYDAFLVPLSAIIVLIIHILFFKDLLFISYDSEMAKLFNYPVVLLNVVLYFTIAFVIALSTRAMGALPVFALLTLPAMFSFQFLENVKAIFIMSALLGIIISIVGYYVSFAFSLPTGASIAFCCSLLFFTSFILNKLHYLRRTRFQFSMRKKTVNN